MKVLMVLNENSSIVCGAMQGVLNAFYILMEELDSQGSHPGDKECQQKSFPLLVGFMT